MKRRREEEDAGSPGIVDRILAALLAPIFFNVSAFIVASLYWRRHPIRSGFIDDYLHLARLALLFSAIAALAGFVFGTRGFADFLGHAFYTHSESQRNPLATTLIWIGIAVLAYDVSAIY